MTESVRYDQLAEALSRLGYAQDAAEYHGALCGALCVKDPEEIDPLQLLERDRAGSEADAVTQIVHGKRKPEISENLNAPMFIMRQAVVSAIKMQG